MGRPCEYSPEKAREICERMADGKGLREICDAEDMPSRTTVFRWLEKEPAFCDQYARAREALFDFIAEEIVRISDDASQDYFIEDRNGASVVVPDHARVQRDRLRVDSRKWLLSKVAPRKYGDKVQVADADGNDPHPITRIERIIIGWKKPEPQPVDSSEPKQLTYDPVPLPANLSPEAWKVLNRVLDTIQCCTPPDSDDPPEKVFAVIEEALRGYHAKPIAVI